MSETTQPAAGKGPGTLIKIANFVLGIIFLCSAFIILPEAVVRTAVGAFGIFLALGFFGVFDDEPK